jgi:endonuclease G
MKKLSPAVTDRFRDLYTNREPARNEKLSTVEAEGVLAAAGMLAAVKRVSHLTISEGRNLEEISGGNDLASVNFLDFGRLASNYVCRILVDGIAIGTGFLVGPGIVMTNQHVIADEADAEKAILQFGFEIGIDGKPAQRRVFRIDLKRPFAISPEASLDFAIFYVLEAEINEFGWLPLEARTDKVLEGEPVLIVQHPDGREKELCLFNSELVDRPDSFIHYTTDTEPGSSGSPVFNRQWQVVGLHHASLRLPIRHRGVNVVANEGIRISKILGALQAGKSEDGVAVLGAPQPLFTDLTDPAVIGNGRPFPPVRTATQTGTSVVDVLVEARGTNVRVRPSEDLEGRDGHREDFLDGLDVPFPTPSTPWQNDLAPVRGRDDFHLAYRHYSVAISKSRRMALYTIVDIDGAQSRSLKRKDRNWRNPVASSPEAAADVWWYDPRIDKAYQLGPEVMDKTKFAFGHLVRREDPVWGNDAVQANDDTFYMTNCSPQHEKFNSGTWLTLENGILDSARKSKEKFVVLTGPVLRFDDPIILGVKVPTAFWKIAVFQRAGQLVAYGFMQWQTKFVEEVADAVRARESLTQLEKIQRYQVPIAEIARATSLDFGPLVSADAGGGSQPLTESLLRQLFPSGFEA